MFAAHVGMIEAIVGDWLGDLVVPVKVGFGVGIAGDAVGIDAESHKSYWVCNALNSAFAEAIVGKAVGEGVGACAATNVSFFLKERRTPMKSIRATCIVLTGGGADRSRVGQSRGYFFFL